MVMGHEMSALLNTQVEVITGNRTITYGSPTTQNLNNLDIGHSRPLKVKPDDAVGVPIYELAYLMLSKFK